MTELILSLSLLAAPAATQEQVQAESARQDAARAEQTEALLQQRLAGLAGLITPTREQGRGGGFRDVRALPALC